MIGWIGPKMILKLHLLSFKMILKLHHNGGGEGGGLGAKHAAATLKQTRKPPIPEFPVPLGSPDSRFGRETGGAPTSLAAACSLS